MNSPTPMEQLIADLTRDRHVSIGFPKPKPGKYNFLPVTPECAGLLVERGFEVRVEKNAGDIIKYPDKAYTSHGVNICPRNHALAADIVVSFDIPDTADIPAMRHNATLFSFLQPDITPVKTFAALIDKKITLCDLALTTLRPGGNYIFDDLYNRLAGQAVIIKSAGILADSVNGKGILFGGLAGIPPCEVTIIGATDAGIACARTALGLGAAVRCFDRDTEALRRAETLTNGRILTGVYLPKVLVSALRTADVVVYCDDKQGGISFTADITAEFKKGVLLFNLGSHPEPFEGFIPADMGGDATPAICRHSCFVNAVSSVPRSAAMAFANEISNLFLNLDPVFDRISNNSFIAGMHNAVCLYAGRVTDSRLASRLHCQIIDISLLLQISIS